MSTERKSWYGVAGQTGRFPRRFIVTVWRTIEDFDARAECIATIVVEPTSEHHNAECDLIAARIAWLLRRDATDT